MGEILAAYFRGAVGGCVSDWFVSMFPAALGCGDGINWKSVIRDGRYYSLLCVDHTSIKPKCFTNGLKSLSEKSKGSF